MLILAMTLALAIPARRISATGRIRLLVPLEIIPIQVVHTGILRDSSLSLEESMYAAVESLVLDRSFMWDFHPHE